MLRPRMVEGISTATTPRLTHRFCLITRLVLRDRPTANGSCARSSAISATSAVSSATSEPAAPMAMPTVALAMAGASLTPSPTIATFPCSVRSFLISSTFCSGIRSPRASVRPTVWATASATFWLSPEIMIKRSMPSLRSSAMTSPATGRGVSITPITPRNWLPLRTIMVVRPSATSFLFASSTSVGTLESGSSVNNTGLPMCTVSPLSCACTPRPVMLLTSDACSKLALSPRRSLAPVTMAAASGWSLCSSTASATASNSSSGTPCAGTTSVSFGLPSVRVPVLSKAMDVSVPRFSSGPPPLTSTPPRAARATPLKTALGTEIAKAQGLAATSTAIAR
mmetsp:Transcript_60030/g.142093  ORF Transcript_60030/g.142093 Transcript_60030/m.142093 type:complete len:339 (-) Transcript_60030:260-1276(-)